MQTTVQVNDVSTGAQHQVKGVAEADLRAETFESQMHHFAAFVGTSKDVIEQLHEFDHVMGGIDQASMQVNFKDMPYDLAEKSVRLFGEKVIPHFVSAA